MSLIPSIGGGIEVSTLLLVIINIEVTTPITSVMRDDLSCRGPLRTRIGVGTFQHLHVLHIDVLDRCTLQVGIDEDTSHHPRQAMGEGQAYISHGCLDLMVWRHTEIRLQGAIETLLVTLVLLLIVNIVGKTYWDGETMEHMTAVAQPSGRGLSSFQIESIFGGVALHLLFIRQQGQSRFLLVVGIGGKVIGDVETVQQHFLQRLVFLALDGSCLHADHVAAIHAAHLDDLRLVVSHLLLAASLRLRAGDHRQGSHHII